MDNFYICDNQGNARGHRSGYPTRESAVRGLDTDIDANPAYPYEFPFTVRDSQNEIVHTLPLSARS
jgi:hypothetical protein